MSHSRVLTCNHQVNNPRTNRIAFRTYKKSYSSFITNILFKFVVFKDYKWTDGINIIETNLKLQHYIRHQQHLLIRCHKTNIGILFTWEHQTHQLTPFTNSLEYCLIFRVIIILFKTIVYTQRKV